MEPHYTPIQCETGTALVHLEDYFLQKGGKVMWLEHLELLIMMRVSLMDIQTLRLQPLMRHSSGHFRANGGGRRERGRGHT